MVCRRSGDSRGGGKGTRAWNQIARKEKRSEHRVSSVPRPSFPSIFVARARAQLEHTVCSLHAYLLDSPSTWNQAFLNICRCLSTCRLPAAIHRFPLVSIGLRASPYEARNNTGVLPSSRTYERTKRDAV